MLEKKRGIQSSGYLFIFWFLLMVCAIPEFRTLINLYDQVSVATSHGDVVSLHSDTFSGKLYILLTWKEMYKFV